MVSDVLHTEGEKRDFTIILVYLLLTSTVSNVNFKNLLQPRAIDAEDASDARLIANSPVGLQAGGKVDGLRTDESNLPTPVNTIMNWLTSFSFFRPASNDMFTYFLHDQLSNGNNRRDDFDMSLLNNIPLPHAAEPRPTGDEEGGMELDALRMDGMSLFDFQEDFAAGLSLGTGMLQEQEVNGQALAYARFNSFDQFLEFNSPESDWKQEFAQSPNCICVDGKLVAFMDPLPTEGTLQNGEDSLPLAELLQHKVNSAAGCAVGTPCASQQNASLLNQDQYVQLLAELGQTNAVEYEGLEQYAYVEQAQQAEEVKHQVEIKQEVTLWTSAPAAAAETRSSSSDHDYAAEFNDEQQMYWPVTQMDQSAFDGATPSAPQVSDDESGVHTDELLDFDPEQNAFGGFDQSPMQAAFVQPHMYNTPNTELSPSLAELEDLDECSEEVDEKSAYTMPKSSYRSKRESGSDAAGSSWHESEDAEAVLDDSEDEDAQSMAMSSATYSSANLPFSDHEIIHSSWSRFEAMLRDRRLSASELQIMKDIRRRGKNKIAAMNCRRRKQNRVDSLRDERVELNQENEQLEAELAHLREQAKMYDARLERALRMLRESDGDVVLAARV